MDMNDSKSKKVERFLAKPDIHEKWEHDYRTTEAQNFYEEAFDYITHFLSAPKDSIFLDAGCGTCAHSIRLAKRGFLVQAVDFSENILEKAKANVRAKAVETRIIIQREDILSFSFKDETFDYVLCWGVLMHIPDLEKAISELTRILKPGGTLVISEANMYSLQAIILRNLKRFLGKEKAEVKKTPAGIEYWIISSSGALLTREANIRWLNDRFRNNGFSVRKRVAGQLTELYTRVSFRPLKKLIHGLNKYWFKYIKIPHPAFGNIVILEKGRKLR